jgi:asparagine synthase (glutamine-hydrolysing)
MPGILGLISSYTEERHFSRMTEVLNHLNYHTEKFIKNGIHLARLHLGYVNTVQQPIFSKNERYALMMIGEIFSYQNFESPQIENDAEFFLSRWIEDGFECLSQMNGQYAVAIYDFVEKRLILISDRFGTRPIYYTKYEDKFLFAPEVKSLVIGTFKKELDYTAVADLFHFGHLFGYKTLFKNIYQLPEASYLIFTEEKLEVKRYWDYPYHEEVYRKRSFTQNEVAGYCEEMKASMLTALKRQVAKDKEDILISLSGGLDSRYVAALANQLCVSPLVAFTMGEPDSEDVIYAKMVARELNIQHQCFQVQPLDIWQDARFFSRVNDGMSMINGPIQGFTPLRYYSGNRKVTLSSQMCDAVLGSTLYRKRIKQISNKAKFDNESRNVILNIFNIFVENQVKSIFTKSIYNEIKDLYLSVPLKYIQSRTHPLHTYFLLLMNEHGRRGTLSGNIMNNLFVETRMPSYDYDLMEFAFRLPIDLRKNQFIYRRAFSQTFPQLAKIPRQGYNLPINASNTQFHFRTIENRIIGRLKSTPLNCIIQRSQRWNHPNYVNYKKWFCYNLKSEIENLIFNPVTASHTMFNMVAIRKLVDEHFTTKQDNSGLIWQVINLEYFLRDNFDKNVAEH